jgi:RNA polymerase sigma factor (sigma-70 family)
MSLKISRRAESLHPPQPGPSGVPYNIRLPRSSTTVVKDTVSLERMALESDLRISEVVKREQSRLRNFIRRRVPDPRDAEDILQDVFCELVEANRLLMPIEHITGWLFRVARNRITDLFRKKKPESFPDAAADAEDELPQLEDLLPSPDAGPAALYARGVLLEELEMALDELPDEQREVFVAHELEGRSFKEMAAGSGVSLNTLLSRKRYAVLHLRQRLQRIYDEFTKA